MKIVKCIEIKNKKFLEGAYYMMDKVENCSNVNLVEVYINEVIVKNEMGTYHRYSDLGKRFGKFKYGQIVEKGEVLYLLETIKPLHFEPGVHVCMNTEGNIILMSKDSLTYIDF